MYAQQALVPDVLDPQWRRWLDGEVAGIPRFFRVLRALRRARVRLSSRRSFELVHHDYLPLD
jgi:hypothetical protein